MDSGGLVGVKLRKLIEEIINHYEYRIVYKILPFVSISDPFMV